MDDSFDPTASPDNLPPTTSTFLECVTFDYKYQDKDGYLLDRTGVEEIDKHKPTALQKNFVKYYIQNGGNAAKAARQAGSSAKDTSDTGAKLYKTPWVRHQVELGLAKMRNANDAHTPEMIIAGLQETIQMAKADGKYSDAIKAYQLLGMELDMFIEKKETRHFQTNIIDHGTANQKLDKLQSILAGTPTGLITREEIEDKIDEAEAREDMQEKMREVKKYSKAVKTESKTVEGKTASNTSTTLEGDISSNPIKGI
jgi:hypothetical protein